jgi:hypothetical protein
MLEFIKQAGNGIDMNTIAYFALTHIYHSNSYPAGLGGYGNNGKAWHYHIPPDLQFRASNNLLRFLATVITPWIDILNGNLKASDCDLSMTDSSTTTEGWLRKTFFHELKEDAIQASVRIDAA